MTSQPPHNDPFQRPSPGTEGEPVYPYPDYGQPQAPQQYYGYPQGSYPQQGAHPQQNPYAQQDPYAQQGHAAYPYAYPGYPYPPAPAPRRRTGLLAGLGALVVAAALVIAAVFVGAGSGTSAVGGQGIALPGTNGGTGNGGTGSGGTGNGNTGNGGTGNANSGKSTATAAQTAGVVTIVSVLKYQRAESAGTGTILTSGGEILTNNHVVNGATSITVTVESTGRSYRASVIGTAPTKDIAVLQLKDASGLTTAKYADSAGDVQVGDAVTGVGNAGGTGTLTAASGSVTDLDQSITATDETGADSERLHNLIEINAPIISGDSGGPLYDSAGEVIGIDTAASSSQQNPATASRAYAITIDNAMTIARQILSGVETTTIHIGLPGFLGIGPVNTTQGVTVQNVETGTPAAQAGIRPGAVITAVGGTKITSTTQLHNLLAKAGPGDHVSVSWTAVNGTSHTATVTLATGPAD